MSTLQKRILQQESVAEVERNGQRVAPVGVLSSSDSNNAQLQEHMENSQAQIEFLNSVIVDIQRKNIELQAKLDAVMANGFVETESDVDIRSETLQHLNQSIAQSIDQAIMSSVNSLIKCLMWGKVEQGICRRWVLNIQDFLYF